MNKEQLKKFRLSRPSECSHGKECKNEDGQCVVCIQEAAEARMESEQDR